MASHYSVQDFRFSSSYTTGGEAFSRPVGTVEPGPNMVVLPQPRSGYVFDHDAATGKIKAYRQNATTGALVEVAAAIDLSVIGVVKVLLVGPG